MKTYSRTYAVVNYRTQVAVVPPAIEALGEEAINDYLDDLESEGLVVTQFEEDGNHIESDGWKVAAQAINKQMSTLTNFPPFKELECWEQLKDSQLAYAAIFAAERQVEDDAEEEELDLSIDNDPDSSDSLFAMAEYILASLRGQEVAM